MICLNCKEAKVVKKKISVTVPVGADRSVEVAGIEAFVCPNCGNQSMSLSEIQKRDRQVLSLLARTYHDKLSELPGSVAAWMRKAIGLSLTEWAKAAHVDPSCFTQAAKRNTMIDQYATLILVLKTIDYLTGQSVSTEVLNKITESANYIEQVRNVKFA